MSRDGEISTATATAKAKRMLSSASNVALFQSALTGIDQSELIRIRAR